MTQETATLWGGRFKEKPDETFSAFNSSFRFDRRLFEADIRASIAHANGLRRAAVLSEDEATKIVNHLTGLRERSKTTSGFFDSKAEDVHSFIEASLISSIGDLGKKLHTGRSRNDQTATALRLWLREKTNGLIGLVSELRSGLIAAAERQKDAVLPGYTHLQRAQPILWAHWCLAYFEMFSRDGERLTEVLKRMNVLPLGSGALAGTGFRVNREEVAKELGFESVTTNSLDAVSDRDFAVEFINACALLMVHLSRMAEDLIIYASAEFGFIELSDAVSTGSSLMPQKKNPDALELIRGKAGRVFGHQTAMHAMLKGLPLAYNKDMQEDKEAIFDTVDTVEGCLRVARIVLDNLSINEERARHASSTGYLNATEMADYLVRKGVPFRQAHETAGKLVLVALGREKELHDLKLEDMRTVSAYIESDVFEKLSLESTLAGKASFGGTSPERVNEALEKAKASLA
jgi:argininosuccinate lyase / amino-acid N-acetyltransferase